KLVEATLPARGFGGLKSETPSHLLGRTRIPYGPAVILGVHLREREIPPANVEVPITRSPYGFEQAGRSVDERTLVVEKDLEFDALSHGHAKDSNAAAADAYSRQLGMDAARSRHQAPAIHSRFRDRVCAQRAGSLARRGAGQPDRAGVIRGGGARPRSWASPLRTSRPRAGSWARGPTCCEGGGSFRPGGAARRNKQAPRTPEP